MQGPIKRRALQIPKRWIKRELASSSAFSLLSAIGLALNIGLDGQAVTSWVLTGFFSFFIVSIVTSLVALSKERLLFGRIEIVDDEIDEVTRQIREMENKK